MAAAPAAPSLASLSPDPLFCTSLDLRTDYLKLHFTDEKIIALCLTFIPLASFETVPEFIDFFRTRSVVAIPAGTSLRINNTDFIYYLLQADPCLASEESFDRIMRIINMALGLIGQQAKFLITRCTVGYQLEPTFLSITPEVDLLFHTERRDHLYYRASHFFKMMSRFGVLEVSRGPDQSFNFIGIEEEEQIVKATIAENLHQFGFYAPNNHILRSRVEAGQFHISGPGSTCEYGTATLLTNRLSVIKGKIGYKLTPTSLATDFNTVFDPRQLILKEEFRPDAITGEDKFNEIIRLCFEYLPLRSFDSIEEFLFFFRERTVLRIPADMLLEIRNTSFLFHRLNTYPEFRKWNGLHKYVFTLNKILALIGEGVDVAVHEGERGYLTFIKMDNTLLFRCNKDYTLSKRRGSIEIRPNFLFEMMIKCGISQLSIDPGQTLSFIGIREEEQTFLEEARDCIGRFCEYLPVGYNTLEINIVANTKIKFMRTINEELSIRIFEMTPEARMKLTIKKI